MASLKDVVRQAHGLAKSKSLADEDPDKTFPAWVQPRHLAWLALPEEERQWSEVALQFATDALRGTYKHPRHHRVSPSSMGSPCERELLFGYGGAPKLPFPPANVEKMDEGTFHHLRWQMEGLSAGYMQAAEVWLHSEALRCGGSADAHLSDGSLFELKKTGDHLYKAIVTGRGSAANYAKGMVAKHKLQMESYWLVDEVGAAERGEQPKLSPFGSLVYQNGSDPSQIYEVRMRTSPARRREVHRILESLHDWIDIDELPDMLEGCARAAAGEQVTTQEMNIYARCAYRLHCPSATGVST